MKITKKQLNQIIKEETEKVILAEENWVDTIVNRAQEEVDLEFDEGYDEDQEHESRLSALDDPKSDEEKFKTLKAKYINMVKRVKKYKLYRKRAQERIKRVGDEFDEEYDFMPKSVMKKRRDEELDEPRKRLAKIEQALDGAAARAQRYYDEAIALKKLIKAKAEEKGQQDAAQQAVTGAAQGAAKAASDSWVGKGWREVMQALKSEFNIQPVKNWYKKLPVRHPARIKYREWYKSRRG